MKKNFLSRALVNGRRALSGVWLLAGLIPAAGQGIDRELMPAVLKPDAVDAAVARSVSFLVRSQGGDGVIQDPDKRSNHATAMTALAVMALAACGHQAADKTPEGRAVQRALQYILLPEDRSQAPGYFGARDGSRMYGHGIITLALTELLGMGADKGQDALLRERAQRAVDLILRSQRVRKFDPRFVGGWRYTPDAGDADLSVTVWQLMALRSAKNAGLVVPKEAIDLAVGYLRRSYFSARDAQGRLANGKSAFGYLPGQAPEYAMAAAGLLAMQVCGLVDAPEVLGAVEWLRAQPVSHQTGWFFYGTYYYAQGLQKRGGDIGRTARERVETLLLSSQEPDGTWSGFDGTEQREGRVYCTAMAVLSLAVRYHYLPIYQD